MPGLESLIPAHWFKDPPNSSVWLQIYAGLGIPHERFRQAVEYLLQGVTPGPLLEFDRPVAFYWGSVSDLSLPTMETVLYTEQTGALGISLTIDERKLTPGPRLFLATPAVVDGERLEERAVRETLSQAAGLLRLHTGANFLRTLEFEGEIGTDGKLSSRGPLIKVPQETDGPFLHPILGRAMAEVVKATATQHEHRRGRVMLSLTLMNEAIEKLNGFLEYWTALEVICNGKANRIKSRLETLYMFENQQQAGERSGLNTLARWRGDYVHKGRLRGLSASVERYLQAMYLDLLRQELDLAPLYFMREAVRLPTMDLSELSVNLPAPRRHPHA